MDIDDGYILWTGIWKGERPRLPACSRLPLHTALGNSKGAPNLFSVAPGLPFSADIVKMIDSQPDLAPVIRRVRGGYLKIQGTWMPYEVSAPIMPFPPPSFPLRSHFACHAGMYLVVPTSLLIIPFQCCLANTRRPCPALWVIPFPFCFALQFTVPPSPTFPSTCLSPDQAGYGQVVATASGRRRPRRTNQSAAPAPPSQQPWPSSMPVHAMPYHRTEQDTSHPSYSYPRQLPDPRVTSPMQRGRQLSSDSTSPLIRSRYSPYPSSVISHRKLSGESVSLDIPSISIHDSDPRSNRLPGDEIKLPPIQPLAPPRHVSNPSYALPPISALEDLRGVSSQDSVAVLERLKMDDAASDARHRSFSLFARSVVRSHENILG